jgi:hypothetical protein
LAAVAATTVIFRFVASVAFLTVVCRALLSLSSWVGVIDASFGWTLLRSKAEFSLLAWSRYCFDAVNERPTTTYMQHMFGKQQIELVAK